MRSWDHEKPVPVCATALGEGLRQWRKIENEGDLMPYADSPDADGEEGCAHAIGRCRLPDEDEAATIAAACDAARLFGPLDVAEVARARARAAVIAAVLPYLHLLTARERRVLAVRFGSLFYGMTLAEVGGRLDVSRERVRQLEASALIALRRGGCPIDAALEQHHAAHAV